MNLLVTGAWSEAKAHIPELERMGHEVRFLQQEKDALPCEPEWVDGVICNGLFLSHPIEKFKNLRYIQLTSAGVDRVPMDYVEAHGIEIHNAHGVYSVPLAEFALCGVLQIYKQSRFFYENQRQHKWEKRRGLVELAGKTVIIVGCGSVGTECAKRFSAFDARVVGVNPVPRDDCCYERIVSVDDLDGLLAQADILVLTLPLKEDTYHMVNARRLALLKSTAILVNISRGAVIDTDALIAWLQRTATASAVLDVFEEEPLSTDSPLWDLENVIVTPHNSFAGDGNKQRLFRLILDNVRKKSK